MKSDEEHTTSPRAWSETSRGSWSGSSAKSAKSVAASHCEETREQRKKRVKNICVERARRARNERLRARRIGLFAENAAGFGQDLRRALKDELSVALKEDGWNEEELLEMEREMIAELLAEQEAHWKDIELADQVDELEHYIARMDMDAQEELNAERSIMCPLCGKGFLFQRGNIFQCDSCLVQVPCMDGCSNVEQLQERLALIFQRHMATSSCRAWPSFHLEIPVGLTDPVLVARCISCGFTDAGQT